MLRTWRSGLIPALAASALFLAACGGSSSNGDDVPDDPVAGDGTDQGFVTVVCDAVNDFRDESTTRIATNPRALSSEEELSKLLAVPFEDFVERFTKAEPPDDMKPWHDEASAELSRVSEDVNNGKGAAEIFANTKLFKEPPPEQRDRLIAAAENVSECEGATVIFGSFD